MVWKAFSYQAENDRPRCGIGLKVQLVIRANREMRAAFVHAADEGCEAVFFGLAQTFEFDKLAAYIRRFHIVGLPILCIVLLIGLQSTIAITAEAEQ